MTKTDKEKAFMCNGCGKKMTTAQAEKAMRKGCSCGEYDIDVNPGGKK